MVKKLLWKIGGEAGFGIMTAGEAFSRFASRNGYKIFDYTEYPSLIRGGHNTYEVCISDLQVSSSKETVDILVCLNEETYLNHKHRLKQSSLVIYDKASFSIDLDVQKINIPFKEIIDKGQAMPVMINNIALSASMALMNWNLSEFEESIKITFKKKGEDVINKNIHIAQLGFEHIKKHYSDKILKDWPVLQEEPQMILTGNDAFSLGCIIADCRLYAAYPMTPSSTVLTTLAGFTSITKMVVRHAEDEIAVINTALGSSYAGVRSAVGTSGGGFALMVESVALSGIAEIPLVIFIASRPGPATGMPTWTAQGDLLFAVHSGHGDFFKIVLAPGDVEEMYEMTAVAFDLADIYQTPVIVLSDKYLSESHQSVSKTKCILYAKSYKPNRGKIISKKPDGQEKYLRYEIVGDGVSPLILPGEEGLCYQANSYEHLEDGHTTEDAQHAKKQMEKRLLKMQTYLKTHFRLPYIYGDINSAEIVLVGFGSTKLSAIEALNILSEKSKKTAYIHFSYVYPMDEEKIKELFIDKTKKYILCENNATGQFGKLLRQYAGITFDKQLLGYDGRPIWPEDIVRFINTI